MIAELVRAHIENTEPADTILAYWKERAGKKFTSRDIDALKIRCKDESIREDSGGIGLCYIEWGGYSRSGGTQGGHVLFARTDTHRVIDPEFLIRENPHAFKARDERNAKRQEFLKSDLDIDAAQRLIDRRLALKAQLDEIDAEIEKLISPDGMLYPDRYTIQREILGRK